MLYLLDANTLIEAEASYYGFDQVPQFWDWLLSECAADRIKMPLEIWNEVKGSNSALGTWINDQATKDVLILDEKPNKKLLNDVTNQAYAPDLSDTELEQVGKDPFLVAYALAGQQRAVVTKEVSKTTQTRGKRKLPDACNIMNVPWMTDFSLYKTLHFNAKNF